MVKLSPTLTLRNNRVKVLLLNSMVDVNYPDRSRPLGCQLWMESNTPTNTTTAIAMPVTQAQVPAS